MGLALMMNLSIHKPFDLHDLAAAAKPVVHRLLPGRVEATDRIHVDVRVRSYDDVLELAPSKPAPWLKTGCLPVGSLLDCYL